MKELKPIELNICMLHFYLFFFLRTITTTTPINAISVTITIRTIGTESPVFTAVLVYMSYEEGKIDLNKSIYDIDNNFVNLKDVKVIDLLSHNQNIWTNGYLGSVSSKEEFYDIRI